MRPKTPRVVSPDEVHIRRDGEQAHIGYADSSYGGMSLNVGPKIARMMDEEIVDLHNEVVRGMEETRERRDHVAVEIPVGQPQIEYSATWEQWVPRGHVRIVFVPEDELEDELVIEVRDPDEG